MVVMAELVLESDVQTCGVKLSMKLGNFRMERFKVRGFDFVTAGELAMEKFGIEIGDNW